MGEDGRRGNGAAADWLGRSWRAPSCEPTIRGATAVGDTCTWCTEIITTDDHSTLIADGAAAGARKPWHVECFTRVVMGGYHHIMRQCRCYGGIMPPDPPGVTKRQAAILAWRAVSDVGRLDPPDSRA